MRWMWIDRIVTLEKGVRCEAVKNVSLAEEHLHDHFPAAAQRPAQPIMPASLMIEGMAQTAGILVGHARDFQEKVILAKIARAELNEEIRPGQTLLYSAVLERMDASGASTQGVIQVADSAAAFTGTVQFREVGRVDLMFSHIDQNMRGLSFPAHNFVFTQQFMDLLSNSGFAAPVAG